MKKKLLFLIPSMKHGGAEKVLVNLVNNLDQKKYDITVQTLFDEGIHKDSLLPHIHYRSVMRKQFRGNTTLFKLFPPRFLWHKLVKGHYDIAISYLEGPTTRILGGCPDPDTRKIAWLHIELDTPKEASIGFRSPAEALRYYNSFDRLVAVSQNAANVFRKNLPVTTPIDVLYNTNETEQILEMSAHPPLHPDFITGTVPTVCSVAKLIPTKGFDRLLEAHRRLLDDGLPHHIYILGIGEERAALERQIARLGIKTSVTLLGFHKNPYSYVARCDLYVCSSHREGFSTAVTEALVVGTPVVSTNCSGAKELLGENDEYGIVVDNSTEGIYHGMKRMLTDSTLLLHYKTKAIERGQRFSRSETVQAVEALFDCI